VRVASLRRMSALRKSELPAMENRPKETLEQIKEITKRNQKKFETIYNQLILELERKGIHIVNQTHLSVEHKLFCKEHFFEKVRPRLVPIMLNERVEFPELRDGQIYFGIRLGFEDGTNKYAVMEIPSDLNRFVKLPDVNGTKSVIFLDDVIRMKLHRIFGIFNPTSCDAYTIKVSRDAELDMDDDIDQGIIEKLSTGVRRRKMGDYVRFVYDQEMPEEMLEFFTRKMKVNSLESIVPGGRYHNKKDLMRFPDFKMEELVFKPEPPLANIALSGSESIMKSIDEKGVLLHTPYQSFGYIVDLLREAAIDPKVTKIRITLYRVARNSRIVNALINAARNGKFVIVVVELQARFDEENNIHWSNKMQEVGIKLIFGVQGLKVHSKLICITRKSSKKSIRYACIGTGNFHEKNAKIYTDVFLLTSQNKLTKEVKKVFDFFETNYERGRYNKLIISPFNTRRKIQSLIQFEIDEAHAGRPASIRLKLNNLVDESMINLLYRASQAGVKIDMVVRGICSLVPGVEGLSENIRVISIVGRYLEHSRLAIFGHGGAPQYYISSADWMTRNLDHRVEVTCPIEDEGHQSELDQIMDMCFNDSLKARLIDKDLKNSYV
ncbi:MAG: polyphosphate kinase 1, partial [Flavobacteriales bacterium]|nr:polyphosphate kinase 1 [Flavobacteriales bacterium]